MKNNFRIIKPSDRRIKDKGKGGRQTKVVTDFRMIAPKMNIGDSFKCKYLEWRIIWKFLYRKKLYKNFKYSSVKNNGKETNRHGVCYCLKQVTSVELI